RPAPGDRLWRRLGTSPALGRGHYRRPDRQPAADPAHHPGGLCLHGQAASGPRPRAPSGARRRRPRKAGRGPCMKEAVMRLPLVLALCAAAAACAIGPDYERPSAPLSATFKEAPPGWAAAQPADAFDRGEWWTLFGDATLNDLAARVQVDNQTII